MLGYSPVQVQRLLITQPVALVVGFIIPLPFICLGLKFLKMKLLQVEGFITIKISSCQVVQFLKTKPLKMVVG